MSTQTSATYEDPSNSLSNRPNLYRQASSFTTAELGHDGHSHPHPLSLNTPRSPELSGSPLAFPGGGGAGVGGSSRGAGRRSSSLRNLGKAIVARGARALRRGNLPFLVIFVSCLFMFFSALAGIGYVDPDASLSNTAAMGTTAVAFIPGVPVFHPSEDQRDSARKRQMEEQRELEKAWQKKKRPKDGAWMKKQRDDKAVRRVKPTSAVEVIPYTTAVEATANSGDAAAEEGPEDV